MAKITIDVQSLQYKDEFYDAGEMSLYLCITQLSDMFWDWNSVF